MPAVSKSKSPDPLRTADVLTLEPVILPAALIVVDAVNEPVDVIPVVVKLPPVILPAALIVVDAVNEPVDVIPVVVKLPPVTLPVTLANPVVIKPVEVTFKTLDVPAALIVTLPLRNVRTFALPFCIPVASIPVSWLPLPNM